MRVIKLGYKDTEVPLKVPLSNGLKVFFTPDRLIYGFSTLFCIFCAAATYTQENLVSSLSNNNLDQQYSNLKLHFCAFLCSIIRKILQKHTKNMIFYLSGSQTSF